MPSSGLKGPFPLTGPGVLSAISGYSAGAYALGRTANGSFEILYIGRSDTDVASRLQQHVSTPHPQFKFDYFPSPKAAFEKECHLYHDFSPPENKVHPARPTGANWLCPVCRIFG